MPRRNSKFLTETGVAKMARAPKGKRIERFDSGADGLALRITDRGTKTWNICYHFPNAQEFGVSSGHDKRDYLARREEIGAAYRALMGKHYPAMAMVEVSALMEDRAKVEIETTAVIETRASKTDP